jgi:hypothetical protein
MHTQGCAGLEMGLVNMFRQLGSRNGARPKNRDRHEAVETSYDRHQNWWVDILTACTCPS